MKTMQESLVPERGCGSCTACCQYLPIRSAELDKPTGTLCPHCELGAGCKVYARRPDPCRKYYCGWRAMVALDEGWRPDNSGIMIRLFEEGGEGLALVVLRSADDLLHERVAALVATAVRAGVNVYVELPGPEGTFLSRTLINPHVEQAVRTRNLEELHRVFLELSIDTALRHQWIPDGLTLRSSL